MNKGPPKIPKYLNNLEKLKRDMKGKSVKELRDMYLSIVPEYDAAIMQAEGKYYKHLQNVLTRIQKLFAKGKWTHVKDTYTAAQCDIFDKKYEDYLIYLESILNKTIADNNWRTPEIIEAIADSAYNHCQKRLEILLQNNAGKYKYESKYVNWGLKNILDAVNIYREKEGKDTYKLFDIVQRQGVKIYAYGIKKPITILNATNQKYVKTRQNLKF